MTSKKNNFVLNRRVTACHCKITIVSQACHRRVTACHCRNTIDLTLWGRVGWGTAPNTTTQEAEHHSPGLRTPEGARSAAAATQALHKPLHTNPHGQAGGTDTSPIGKITARQPPWPGGRQGQRGHPPRGPDGRSSQEAEEAGPAPGSQPARQPALQAAGQPAPPQSRSEPGAAPEANLRQSRGKPVANPVANLGQTSLPSGLSRGTHIEFWTRYRGVGFQICNTSRGLNR